MRLDASMPVALQMSQNELQAIYRDYVEVFATLTSWLEYGARLRAEGQALEVRLCQQLQVDHGMSATAATLAAMLLSKNREAQRFVQCLSQLNHLGH